MIAKHGRARDKRAMLPALTIIDDFLSDPWAARRAALALDYAPPGTGGNYPGRDTTGALPVDAIDASVSRQLGVDLVGAPGTEHGHCRMTLKADRGRSGVHVDPAFYSGILYLSRPEDCLKPGAGGTDFFRHKRTGLERVPANGAELAATGKAILAWHENHGYCARCGFETVVNDAGWQRNCPACRASHFPRTDPVVIMLITHGNSVLMGRSPGWPEGMFSLLAGFVEPGETLEAAVRREVFEEAGVQVGQVSYLASQPWPFPTSLMIGCRGEALSEEITIDPKEIEDALWVPREEIMQAIRDHQAGKF